MHSEQIDQLTAALVAAQAEMPAAKKDSDNPFFKSKYADLAGIVETAKPVLAKHKLAVAQFVAHDGDHNTLVTWLVHESGQYIADEMLLMLPKDDPQGQGSAITYARRYAYQAAIGMVADDDDDGNRAAAPRQRPNVQPEPATISADNLAKFQARCIELHVDVAEAVKNATSGRTDDPAEVLTSEITALRNAVEVLAAEPAA